MENVFLPHGNEQKKLRNMQNKFCADFSLLPIFPLVIKGIRLPQKNEQFLSLKSGGIFEKNDFFALEMHGKIENEDSKIVREENGFIFLGKKIAQFSKKIDDFPIFPSILFPVFQIAELETKIDGICTHWKIKRGKWIRARCFL